MTLKTSSRKINPFWNMINFTLRKNIGIIIVLCIMAFVFFPGSFIVNREQLITRTEFRNNYFYLETFGTTITVLSAVVAVLFNMLNFGFLYKKSSSDVFHAFPLTRIELLLSRFLSGVISTLIPTLLCYVSFSIVLPFNSWLGTFPLLLYYLLHTIIILLVCSSFSMLFVVCAGSAFDLGLSLIGGNLALLAVGSIFETILDETLVGYNAYHGTSNIIYNISPPYLCGVGLQLVNNAQDKYVTAQSIDFFIRSIICIVAFTAISLLLFNRRKAEKGGTAYAYKFMYLGCSLLAGICGGYIFGEIFSGDVLELTFWFFGIIGCLLTTVIYGTITNRGFKGVSKSIIMGAISATIMILVAVSGITGGFGYSNRIPKTAKVESVQIEVFGEIITFDNPQQVIDLHKAIRDTDATNFDETIYVDEYYDDEYYTDEHIETQYIIIEYQLKNGKTLSRTFNVDASKVSKELLSIYRSEERFDMINEHLDFANADKIELHFTYEDEYYTINVTETESKELLTAYWKDVQNCDAQVFSRYNDQFVEFSGEKILSKNRIDYFNFTLEYRDSFTNTKQFISEIKTTFL